MWIIFCSPVCNVLIFMPTTYYTVKQKFNYAGKRITQLKTFFGIYHSQGDKPGLPRIPNVSEKHYLLFLNLTTFFLGKIWKPQRWMMYFSKNFVSCFWRSILIFHPSPIVFCKVFRKSSINTLEFFKTWNWIKTSPYFKQKTWRGRTWIVTSNAFTSSILHINFSYKNSGSVVCKR